METHDLQAPSLPADLRPTFLAAAYHHAPIATGFYSQAGKLVEFNPALLKLMGFANQEQAARYNLFDFSFLPEQAKAQLREEQALHLIFEYDFNHAYVLGHYRGLRSGTAYFEAWVTPLRHGDGSFLGYLVHVQDVTERQENEAALGESEGLYRMLFESAGDAIYVHTFDGKILDVNRTGLEQLGYERNEFINRNLREFNSQLFVDRLEEAREKLSQTGHAYFESEHVARDGRIIPVEINAKVIEYNGKPAVMSLSRDITDRKVADKRIAELNERFTKAFELNPMPMMLHFLESGKVLDANRSFVKIFGYTHEDILGNTATEVGFITEETRQRIVNAAAAKGSVHYMNLSMRAKRGDPLEGRISAEIITLGTCKCLLSTFIFQR